MSICFTQDVQKYVLYSYLSWFPAFSVVYRDMIKKIGIRKNTRPENPHPFSHVRQCFVQLIAKRLQNRIEVIVLHAVTGIVPEKRHHNMADKLGKPEVTHENCILSDF